MYHQDFLIVQDRKPLVEVQEIPADLLNKKDLKDDEYPMDSDQAKAEFLKASWAGRGKFQTCCVSQGLHEAKKNTWLGE